MNNPNNCAACNHKANPDGGWCYMFSNEPSTICMQHTARRALSAQPPAPRVQQALAELANDGLHGLTAPPPVRERLTDAEIEAVITKAVQANELPWMGFKKDENGEYTLPSISGMHIGIARAIERALIGGAIKRATGEAK